MASKWRYVNLLQIGGALAIIAFHVGLWGLKSVGWIAVIVFFVLAGHNMAGTAGRSQSVFKYAGLRFHRMAFELAIVWCLVALMT